MSRLILLRETQLIAFYISKLGHEQQVLIYANYLENIVANDERAEALAFGEASNLDVQAITVQIVENVISRPHEVGDLGDLLVRDKQFYLVLFTVLLLFSAKVN